MPDQAPPTLDQPITLPCGVTLPNRLCKGAMTEGLADSWNRATERHVRLYRRWAAGGSGMLLTGNIQGDRRYLERPGNVAVDNNGGMEALRAYAAAATEGGTQAWVQIGHAGRQTPRTVNEEPVGPSAVPLDGALVKRHAPPRALTIEEVRDVPRRMATVASACREAGFTGCQLHAAHGYLLSSFLSPKANLREDAYGGPLENRARLLLEAIAAVRAAVGPDYPVSVKLNSSDFQKGGFTHEECLTVVGWLNGAQVDLMEVSGGNYENPVLISGEATGDGSARPAGMAESTYQRESYFLGFAESIRKVAEMPLMVTGGFRTRAGINAALAAGAMDVAGIARPLVPDPAFSAKLLADGPEPDTRYEATLSGGRLVQWYYKQILLIADGGEPDLTIPVDVAGQEVSAHDNAQAAALEGMPGR